MAYWQHVVGLQDIDAAGIVFCGHFGDWVHRAYEAALHQAGINLLALGEIVLPLSRLELAFHQPLLHGTNITARISLAERRQRSFSLTIQLVDCSDTGRCYCSANSVHCCRQRAALNTSDSLEGRIGAAVGLPPAVVSWLDSLPVQHSDEAS